METTTQLTAEICWTALRNVIDPEIYQNIVDLGLVYDVEVLPEQAVVVTMTLTTPHCPLGPQIMANVEQELQSVGAGAVTVNIVWSPPWTPDAMTPDLKRLLGIVPDEDEELEPELELDLPPPAKKKGGLLGWLFR
jgi:metal-sulfur cluster biosynthetic enzyme